MIKVDPTGRLSLRCQRCAHQVSAMSTAGLVAGCQDHDDFHAQQDQQ